MHFIIAYLIFIKKEENHITYKSFVNSFYICKNCIKKYEKTGVRLRMSKKSSIFAADFGKLKGER